MRFNLFSTSAYRNFNVNPPHDVYTANSSSVLGTLGLYAEEPEEEGPIQL